MLVLEHDGKASTNRFYGPCQKTSLRQSASERAKMPGNDSDVHDEQQPPADPTLDYLAMKRNPSATSQANLAREPTVTLSLPNQF